MKRIISLITLVFICFFSSCDKNEEHIEDDIYYTTGLIIIKGAPFHNNRIEYYIEYPNFVKLGEQAILRVKTDIKGEKLDRLVYYSFYDPSNGTITENVIPSDDPKIIIREYIFEPASTGEAKIYTNILHDSDHIVITVE